MFSRSDTVSGFRLLQKWHIGPVYLSYLIMKHDLTVLEADPVKDSTLRPFLKSRYSPRDMQEFIEIIKNDPELLYDKLFLVSELERIAGEIDLPAAAESAPMQILKGSPEEQAEERIEGWDVENLAYDADCPVGIPADIEFIGDRKNIPLSAGVNPLKLVIEEHESDIKKSSNVFSLIGKVWFVKFAQDEWGLYPDQKKYRYIARVLSLSGNPKSHDPEYSIYNTELCQEVSGTATANTFHIDDEGMREWNESDLNESELSDNLSVEDVNKLKKQGDALLEQLCDARQGGNQDRIKRAQNNIEKYRSYLSNEYGVTTAVSKDETKLSFKVRYRPSPEAERSRQLAKNQINKAIKDFDTMPRLKAHLQHSLKMKSNKTFYSPEQPIAWYVSI